MFEVDRGIRDLSWLADHPHQKAESGKPGARAKPNRPGGGDDLVIPVPDGTRVEDENGLLADLVGEGASAVVARGGRGGRGNASLAGPKNRVPRTAEAGEPGEEKRLHVELRTVADVGPGRSSERREVDAPFEAHGRATEDRGVPVHHDHPQPRRRRGPDQRFVIADVAGLVEGAHEGRGSVTCSFDTSAAAARS